MRRREFVRLVSAAIALAPAGARAQSDRKLPVVASMFSGRDDDPRAIGELEAFKTGLESLGWKDGRDIRLVHRWGADYENAARLAAELVSMSPTLIMSGGTSNLAAFRDATKSIPIVFVNVADPVAGGFVASLARPGGNITGITPFEYEIGGKWLQLLTELAPGVKRVALLGDPSNPNFKGFQKSAGEFAKSVSIETVAIGVQTPEDLDRSVGSFAREPNGGLIVTAGIFSSLYRNQVVNVIARHGLPTIYWNRAHVVAGGLMSYGPNIADTFRQAAGYADRILRGAKPSELAVQTPVKIELIVNGKTAKSLGLAIPLTILSSADEVIE